MSAPFSLLNCLFSVGFGTLALGSGCTPHVTEAHWETSCENACNARAARCSEQQCRRGCGFALDRAAEQTSDAVIACIAHQSTCDDPAWAFCGARVGALKNGGPPAPPPPKDPADGED
jgi:hypothetical protein